MVAKVDVNDIENSQLSGNYLMIDEINWVTNTIISSILGKSAFYGCDLDTDLVERIVRSNSIEKAMFNIRIEIESGNPIIMNFNGGYHVYNKKRHIIMSQIEFEDIYTNYKVAINWLNHCKREYEKIEYRKQNGNVDYPYLCGILLNTGQFLYCKYGEHKYISQHLIDNNIDISNAIIIGSHPKDEFKSYIHLEGDILQIQRDFLIKNIELLNNKHKDILKL